MLTVRGEGEEQNLLPDMWFDGYQQSAHAPTPGRRHLPCALEGDVCGIRVGGFEGLEESCLLSPKAYTVPASVPANTVTATGGETE